MNRVFIYPNGMVEVEAGYDEAAEEMSACFGVEDTEEAPEECDDPEPVVDPVSDALDVLDHYFAPPAYREFKEVLRAMRRQHNAIVWARYL